MNYAGHGFYTSREASCFLHTAGAKLRRWLKGENPLWRSEYVDLTRFGISFHDLTELKVVIAMLEKGLRLPKIRRAIQIAEREFNISHPLSYKAFYSDGVNIFMQIDEGKEDSGNFIDIEKRQAAFKTIIEFSITGLNYDEIEKKPISWEIFDGILLDPSKSFGMPIDKEFKVPVSALVDAVTSEGSVRAAANSFLVSEQAVKNALRFNEKFPL